MDFNNAQDMQLGTTPIQKVILGGSTVWERVVSSGLDLTFTPTNSFIEVYAEGTGFECNGVPFVQGAVPVNPGVENIITASGATFFSFVDTYPITQLHIEAIPQTITEMSYLVDGQATLTSVTVSSPEITAHVITLESGFKGCEILAVIPQLNTSAVQTFEDVFSGCDALVVIPDWDFSNALNMEGFARGCSTLTHVESLDTPLCLTYNLAFRECTALVSIGFMDTSSVEIMSDTFMACGALACIGNTVDYTNVTDGVDCFDGCISLISPPSTGSPVRSGNTATPGVWVNPETCPAP